MVNDPELEIELVDLDDAVWNSLLHKALQGETFVDEDSLAPDMDLEPEVPIDDNMDEELVLSEELISTADDDGVSDTDEFTKVDEVGVNDTDGIDTTISDNDGGYSFNDIQDFEIPDFGEDSGSGLIY